MASVGVPRIRITTWQQYTQQCLEVKGVVGDVVHWLHNTYHYFINFDIDGGHKYLFKVNDTLGPR